MALARRARKEENVCSSEQDINYVSYYMYGMCTNFVRVKESFSILESHSAELPFLRHGEAIKFFIQFTLLSEER